jgi:DNA-binding NarL/FixJ family response regulator
MPPGPLRALTLFGYAVIIMHTEGYSQAAKVLSEAIDDAVGTPAVCVQVRMMLAFALINDGVYEPALDQARQALDEAEDAAESVLISQALAVWSLVSFNCGLGYDEAVMRRALELEDHEGDTPIPFRATAIHALLMAWTGRLEQSAAALEAVGHGLVQRGGEIELLFVSYNSALINVWWGHYEAAERYAEDTMQRAEQIGGAAMRALGRAVRGWVSAHVGRAESARDDLTAAIDAAQRYGSSPWWFDLAVMGLGRLEVSLGRHEAALDVLAPLLAVAERLPTTEISKAEYLPDVIEAMIVTSRLDEAKTLIDRLDANGRELDRAWMLAAAARCRGMWLAATGDVDAAVEVVQAAMVHHQRLPMPLEQARTHLVLGQLQRRRRQKQVAAQALNDALRIFEQLGNPLWVERTHAELVRTTMSAGRADDLTPTERRVADLAAEGMSNRDVAAALYISAKTVEAHLSRIYRKLGIRSRAELGRRIDQIHEAED